MGYTAIVVGASGLTGSFLLNELLLSKHYESVITLSRKRNKLQHLKHTNYVVDLLNSATYLEVLKGDHLFICTGTTQAKTPDADDYYRIEHDLPLAVAQVAKGNAVKKVIAISALGAAPDSRFSYNRGKGEMERDIEALGFDETYFVQPALIGGDRIEKRPFESLWKKLQAVIDPLLLGSLKNIE